MRKYIAGLVLFLLLSVFANGQKITVGDIDKFYVEKLDKKEAVIGFSAMVENNTNKNIGARIKSGKIYKDGKLIGTFKSFEKVKIKAKSNEDVNAKVKVELGENFNLMKEGLKALSGGKIELKITGHVSATWFIFWKRILFEHVEEISLSRFLK